MKKIQHTRYYAFGYGAVRAIAALQKLLSIPYEAPLAVNIPLTPALLRLDPMFDPLRNDPRLEALVQKVVGAEHK